MITDKDLIQFKKGKRKAFNKIYEAYASGMYGIALRYTSCEDDAQEIVQEAFIKLYEKRDLFDATKSIGAWIKRITINCAINLIRKQKRFVSPFNDETVVIEVEEEDNDSEISQEKLLAALNQLPDGYRMVFNLYAIENLKHQEIADYLGISVNTSKSQLFKAKRMLREILTVSKATAV